MDFPNSMKRYLLLAVVVLILGGCKSSPSSDESELTINTVPAANSEVSQTEEIFEPSAGTLLFGKFNLFPRETNGWDKNGWSVLTPANDSRLIYVSSSSGNDDTGDFVTPNSVVEIYNPNGIKPFKTIEAALSMARTGFPDWVLLKRGDSWDVTDILSVRAGRSIYERSVLTSYGAGSPRPVINTRADNGLRIWIDVDFVAIVGISLYAASRDPESSEFAGWGKVGNPSGIYMYQPEDNLKKSILLEDNEINYFGTGVLMTGPGRLEDVVIRRNIVRNSYSETSHSQGLYAAHASVLLEENIFDHNGWYKRQAGAGNDNTQGQATFFNHNTYFSDANDTISRRNIFLRPSSIHQKWTANSPQSGSVDQIMSRNILISDNLFVGGEVGISAGGNTDKQTGPRWANINIIDNVLLAIGRDRPTNRNLGWYVEVDDWSGGEICGNYLLNNDNPDVTNLIGISITGHSSEVAATKNIIYGLKRNTSSGIGAINIDSAPKNGIVVAENRIQLINSQMKVLTADAGIDASYQGNVYFSDADITQWFTLKGDKYGFDDWVMFSGDIGSRVDETTSYDERSFETYLSSIGFSDSIDEFMEEIVSQSRSSWSQVFTAEAINAYIRDGYGDTVCGRLEQDFFTFND